MEFLPAENTSGPFAPSVNGSADNTGFKGKGKEKEPITRVRLAWYYRPSDLSDRAVADSRLLFAAIFSEIQPVAFLRAKCHVKHKDKIADLSGWKKRPDRFYFSRLFDPYIKKEYEVIRSADVRNCEWCLELLGSDWRSAVPEGFFFVYFRRAGSLTANRTFQCPHRFSTSSRSATNLLSPREKLLAI